MIFRFWRKPRITQADVERREHAEWTLKRLEQINERAAGVSHLARYARQENNFSKAIFGGPRE